MAKIQKDFVFECAIHFEEKFIINFYELTLFMEVNTDNQYEQNIAIERVNYYLTSVIDNSIFVNQSDKKAIENYENAGIRVITLPEDPYDQIIGLLLILKLNAIMENKVTVTEIIFQSKLTAGIKFHTYVEETEDYRGKYWWTENTPCYKLVSKSKKDKVVKLFENDTWAELGLTWKEKKVDND
jgi:hypothetical protein